MHKILLGILVSSTLLLAVSAFPGEITFQQPDGSVFKAKLQGDEHFHWIKLKSGNVAIYNRKNKQYEHAKIEKNKRGNYELVPSGRKVTQSSNRSNNTSIHKVNRAQLQEIWHRKAKERKKAIKESFNF